MPAILRHILVKTREQAEQLKTQLANGVDFTKLAKQHSTCNSAKKGQLVKPIDSVVFNFTHD